MAYAQNVLQGNWFADPFYKGESLWYNPLVPALAAGTSQLTGVALHRLYAAYGWAFNLLVPIALVAFVCRVSNRWAALLSVSFFIFWPSPGVPPWGWASYSPWLFPTVFAQSLFYATLVALAGAFRSNRWSLYLLSGAGLGLTFLAHTAPALLLGGVLVVEGLRRIVGRRRQPASPYFRRAGVALAVSAALSLPLTLSIVGRYHLHVLNPSPADWAFTEASFEQLPRLVGQLLTVTGVLAAVGCAWLVSSPLRRARAGVLIGWAASNLGWLAVMYAFQIAARLGLTASTPVPSYHFLFYWRALVAVLAGCGAFSVVDTLPKLAARLVSRQRHLTFSTPPAWAWPTTVVLALVATTATAAFAYPRFASRYDMTVAVSSSEDRGRRVGDLRAWAWISRQTAKGAVFLAYDDVGLFVIGPAGRKTVAVGQYFSNPYVDRDRRLEARSGMWSALRAGDRNRFCGLARPFDVSFVVLGEEQPAEWASAMGTFLVPAFSAPGIRIWQVIGCRD